MTTHAVDLKAVERACVLRVLDVLEQYQLGHSGGSLSVLQTLIALYWEVARVDPANPRWPERDRIVLSKAHAVEAMYAVLAERGFFPVERLSEYLQWASDFQGHTEIMVPGVEYSGGSLGQGIGFACGMAYAAKLRGQAHRVFAVVGDGECHEGSVWEAAMFAAHYRLANLTVIVDYNHYADHDDVDVLMNLRPLDEKWRAFGWETAVLDDGNDIGAVAAALRSFSTSDAPKCLIAHTVKNHGVPMWEQSHAHMLGGKAVVDGVAEGRRIWRDR
jgi:transketolase